jgi:kumamolisin
MELSGSARGAPPGAKDLGRASPSETVDLTLLLRRRSEPSLPLGRPFLSREEFAERHGLAPGDLKAVRAFARRAGFRVGAVSRAARTVHLEGSVAQVEAAFGSELHRWSSGAETFRGRTGTLSLPVELVGPVEGVFGDDTRPLARPHFRIHTTAAAGDVAYSPPAVAAAYDFPAGTDGSGATIGILELGGGYFPADLTNFFGGLGLPVPTVVAVGVDGGENAPTGSPSGPDGEVELDIEVAGSCAPGAQLVVYFAPNTDQGILDGLTSAIHDTAHHPEILSLSWGAPESAYSAQSLAAVNGACQDAASLGVTLLVAAGDQGATDGASGGQLEVDFPASSPYAIGCGGTRLVLVPTRQEVVWNEEAIGEGATGGGVSRVFPKPNYQTSAAVPTGPGGFVGRGVPDVAGDADPTTGYRVVVDGQATVIGGTSAVAPLWAALVARLNQALGSPVGYLTPELYAAPESTAFFEITSGNNDGYSAGPGWNPCTGWGSPNGTALLAALRNPPSAADPPRGTRRR